MQYVPGIRSCERVWWGCKEVICICLLFRNYSLVACGGMERASGMGQFVAGAEAIVTLQVLNKLRKCMWMSTLIWCVRLHSHGYMLHRLSIVWQHNWGSLFVGGKTSFGSWLQRFWPIVSLCYCLDSMTVQYISGTWQRRNKGNKGKVGLCISFKACFWSSKYPSSYWVHLLKVPQPPRSATSWRHLDPLPPA